jgi:hypothetical protein
MNKKNALSHSYPVYPAILLLFLFFSCTPKTEEHWHSEQVFESASRLVYSNPDSHLKLEFLKLGEGLTAFLFLDGHAFESSQVELVIDAQTWSEISRLRKGQMRLKLSSEMTHRIISALQEGREIGILTGGFQENISPAAFQGAYDRFIRGNTSLISQIKGPIE